MNTHQAQELAEKLLTEGVADEDAYTHAVSLIREASAAYYQTETVLIDDPTYDKLVALITEAEERHPEWSLDGRRVSETVAAGAEVAGEHRHTIRMLSLDNIFDEDALTAFNNRMRAKTRKSEVEIVCEPKLDGLAISAHYENGHLIRLVTRGDGVSGEIVTHVIGRDHVEGLPQTLGGELAGKSLEIRGEMLMTQAQFEEANRRREKNGDNRFANPRNAVAGSVRAQDRRYALPLTFIGYDLVGAESHGYTTHHDAMTAVGEAGVLCGTNLTLHDGEPALTLCDTNTVTAAIRRIEEIRTELEFAVDGAVLKLNAYADRRALGEGSRAPRWAVAYKYAAELALTQLVDITYGVGRTGRVTPVAVLEAVEVGGVTVTSATLNNHTDLARKDVRVGDWVWVRRAGEVIPEVVGPELSKRPEDSKPYVAPTTCPRCSAELDRTEMVWRCPNRDCGKAEAILYFASRDAMDIDGLGDAAVKALLDAGLVEDPADLYSLHTTDIANLPGYGEKSAENLVAAITASKEAGLVRVLTSLGVRHLGRRLSTRVAAKYPNMDALLEALDAEGAAALQEIDGFGKVKGEEVAAGLNEMRELIQKLQDVGVKMEAEAKATATTDIQGLAGMRILITGTVPGQTRESAQAYAEAAGADVASSVSGKLNAVLSGADPGGSKIAKAESLGIPVIDVTEEGSFETICREGLPS